MSKLNLIGWTVLLSTASTVVAAELDEINLRLLEQYDTPLRWDNIEGPPQWVGGAALTFEPRRRLHEVDLKPGQSVDVKLAPFSMLRVTTPSTRISATDLEIWLSNGTGLFLLQTPSPTSNGDALIIAPDRSSTMIARIKRPESCSRGLRAALFTSRRKILDKVAPYRKLIPLGNLAVELKSDVEPDVVSYFEISPQQPRRLFVEGPARFAFETRLHYPPRESRRYQCYRVTVRLNGELLQHLEYETSSDFHGRVWVDGRLANLGRRETAYLNIPAGRHALRLSSTASIYARVLQQNTPDYEKPFLNEPSISVERVTQENLPLNNLISLWDISREDIQHWADAGPRFVAAQERVALFSARNNEHRDGGMQAWMLMRRAAAQRPDHPPVHTVARKIRGFHTHFRDLLPSDAAGFLTHRHNWYHVRRLRSPSEPHRNLVLGRQHIQDALRHLAKGHFLRLSADQVLIFRLPRDRGDTVLRIAVDRSWCGSQHQFYVQFDDGPPMLGC